MANKNLRTDSSGCIPSCSDLNVNIVKHKNDVFRLVMMLPGDKKYPTPEIIHSHLQEFANSVAPLLPSPATLKSNGFGNQDMKEVFSAFCKAFQLQNPNNQNE